LYFTPALKPRLFVAWWVSFASAWVVITSPSSEDTGRPGTVFGVVV
jgi:hypothetical protein